MARPRLSFRPQWSGPIQGYTVNTVRAVWPKLCVHSEFEDLLQEGYVVFLICARRYCAPDRPRRPTLAQARRGWGYCDDPRWFMALYKTALRNRLCDLMKAVRPYNLVDGDSAVFDVPVFDLGIELCEMGDGLADDLQLILHDLIRPKSRLKVTRLMREQLARALVGNT